MFHGMFTTPATLAASYCWGPRVGPGGPPCAMPQDANPRVQPRRQGAEAAQPQSKKGLLVISCWLQSYS
eukprot:5447958-Amphidinium_carterae.1